MFAFLLLALAIPAAAETVDIVRDAFGTPHIFAATPAGAAYGAGYAQAADRPDALLENLTAESGGETPELPAPLLSFVESYAAGINRYFSEHPERKAPQIEAPQIAAFARKAYLWIQGSNDLVLDRTRTSSRSVIAVLDPLTDWNLPNRPYEMSLYASNGNFSVAGVAPVGMPFPVVGHSQYVAVGWSPETPGKAVTAGPRALEEAWELITSRGIADVRRALGMNQIPGHAMVGTSEGDIFDSSGAKPEDGYLRRASPSPIGDAVAKEELRVQHTWSRGRIENLAFSTEVYKADSWLKRLAHSMPEHKFVRRLTGWNRRADPASWQALAFYEFKVALDRDAALFEPPDSLSDARLRAAVARAEERLEAHLDFNSTYGTLFRATREGSLLSFPAGGGNLPEVGIETPRSYRFSPTAKSDPRALRLTHVGQAATRIVELSSQPEAGSILLPGVSDDPQSPFFQNQAREFAIRGAPKRAFFLNRRELERTASSSKRLIF